MLNKRPPFQQKLSTFLLYLFVFLLPWQTVFLLQEKIIAGEKFQYDTIGIYLFEIILFVWILTISNFSQIRCSLLFQYFKNFLNHSILNISIFLFTLWSILSIIWAPDKSLAVSFSLKLILGITLFFIISQSKKFRQINIKKIIVVFLISATIQGILGIWQFTEQKTFSNKWLGTTSHIIWQGGTSVLQNKSGRWLRAYGGLEHPNILAGYLLIALFFSFCLYLLSINKSVFYKKILFYFSITIIFFAFLITFSRTAYLAFSIGLFLFFIYIVSQKKKSLLRKLFFPFLTIILITIFFTTTYSNLLLSRVTSISRLEQKSINDRLLYISEAENQINQHPFIGVGLNNYTLSVYNDDIYKKPGWQYQPVHNVFILILAELGLIGLVLFASIIIQLLWHISIIFKEPFQKKELPKIFFAIAFISLIIIFIFDHWLWTSDFGFFLFWLVAGFLMKRDYL